MEEVLGDRMTFTVQGLTPSTLYYYKMQARNIKGFGPFSAVGNFTTLPGINVLILSVYLDIFLVDFFIIIFIVVTKYINYNCSFTNQVKVC